ncbi:MAG: acyloxyacyl hydrolase [Acidobacteria bacterium]|nr:acyloxyacyl hydrolase [Acidobacteriota bacterium]
MKLVRARSLLIWLLGSAVSIFAQENSPPVVPQSHSWLTGSELRVVGGYSPLSTKLIGVTHNRRLVFTALEYAVPLAHFHGVTLGYYGGIVPFVSIHKPAEPINGTAYPAATNWGGGVEPLGFSFSFRNTSKLRPFFDTAGGILYFNDQVPIAQSSQFNFMFHFGGGIELYRNGSHFLTLGFRYHHISNADTAHFNPGIDSNLFYVAVPIWKRAR